MRDRRRGGRWLHQQQQQEEGWQGLLGQQSQPQQRKVHGGTTDRPHPPRRNSGRPPLAPADSSCQSVPLWEKKFCTDVCRIPWKKICETRKVMSMYTDVVQWNDSAGEESFRDAKSRFWAKINGLPCDIPLPDPNMYIDEINQNIFINPELIEDLYKQPPTMDDDDNSPKQGWDSFLFADTPVPVSGWGDTEDPVPVTGWDNVQDKITSIRWGSHNGVPVSGWGEAGDPIPVTAWVDIQDNITANGKGTYDQIPASGWDEAEDSVPVTGPDDVEDKITATGWGSYDAVPMTGWVDPQDPIPVTGRDDVQDKIAAITWGSYDDVPATGWGDVEESVPSVMNDAWTIVPTGLEDINCKQNVSIMNGSVKIINRKVNETYWEDQKLSQLGKQLLHGKTGGGSNKKSAYLESCNDKPGGRYEKKKTNHQYASRSSYSISQENGYQPNPGRNYREINRTESRHE